MPQGRQCDTCIHLKDATQFVCKYFPKGIPQKYITGQEEHSKYINHVTGTKQTIGGRLGR